MNSTMTNINEKIQSIFRKISELDEEVIDELMKAIEAFDKNTRATSKTNERY